MNHGLLDKLIMCPECMGTGLGDVNLLCSLCGGCGKIKLEVLEELNITHHEVEDLPKDLNPE